MSLISYGTNRVFVDVAYSGCGSGCKYCYVNSAREPQILISNNDRINIIKSLLSVKDLNDKIISFSPNTEPFKNEECSKIVVDIIKNIIHSGVSIQISTKERINKEYLDFLNNISIRDGQIIVNISMPIISSCNTMEPGTANIEKRLKNFIDISKYDRIKCCLYIKPYIDKLTYYDLDKYISIINNYNIEYVCVGMRFYNNDLIEPCRSYYNDIVMDDTIKKNNMERIMEFADEIRTKTNAIVVFSSTCLFAKYCNGKCSVQFYLHNPNLCKNCNIKEKIYENK